MEDIYIYILYTYTVSCTYIRFIPIVFPTCTKERAYYIVHYTLSCNNDLYHNTLYTYTYVPHTMLRPQLKERDALKQYCFHQNHPAVMIGKKLYIPPILRTKAVRFRVYLHELLLHLYTLVSLRNITYDSELLIVR